ncbi:response regulator [Salisediminibacterium selenitireducens]|uniref:Response regulator receiver and SARP domain protein n=1 Tax=Bacillus selenitireducens (strain ATCC 700615 / DSM 15326 / MLS10) TaxID=439292 RepID=D6XZM7_BACIE|nr:response regulator [Salisediminibacterium selenitireducens]ADH98401.1 response regulator receiver and SARP domain protein [[Bacillus] selenitireducens MLS10]
MNVLIVDDDPVIIGTLGTSLYSYHSVKHVSSTESPKNVMNIIKNNHVDVIFLDIHMPGIDGMELAEIILEENPSIEIVFITASSDYALKAFEVNAIDYIVKPVNIDRLSRTIQRLEKIKQIEPKKNISKHIDISVANEFSLSLGSNRHVYFNWRTSKSLELFLYLLHHVDKPVPKTHIIDVIWEGTEDSKASQQMYTTIYHIRKIISEYSDFMKIINKNGCYMLQTNHCRIDLFDWYKKITAMPPLTEQSTIEYSNILHANKGSYLSSYQYLWADSRTDQYDQYWISIALSLAHFYFRRFKVAEAKYWFIKVTERDPVNEEAYFYLMKLAHYESNEAKVEEYYLELTKNLDEELGTEPGDEIADWYLEWRVGRTINN